MAMPLIQMARFYVCWKYIVSDIYTLTDSKTWDDTVETLVTTLSDSVSLTLSLTTQTRDNLKLHVVLSHFSVTQ